MKRHGVGTAPGGREGRWEPPADTAATENVRNLNQRWYRCVVETGCTAGGRYAVITAISQ